MTQNLRIDGARQLAAALKRLDDDVRKRIGRAACRDGAKVIRQEAENSAPPRATAPIHIADSIKVSVDNKASTRFSWVYLVRVSRKAFYWVWIEFGLPSRNISPNPFMRTSFERTWPESVQAMGTTLRRRLRKYGLR